MSSNRFSVEEVKEYFFTEYSHISLNLADDEIEAWLDQIPNISSIAILCDRLADYILANGLASEVQE